MKNIALLIVIIALIASCDDGNSTKSSSPPCEKTIIISSMLYKTAPDDRFHFEDVEVVGNCLEMTISYGGGCGEVGYELIDAGVVYYSMPPQRELRLSFKDDDLCEALIRKTISFDLRPIILSNTNEIILRLSDWEDTLIYRY